MKPQRQLAIPYRPHFAEEKDGVNAKIPEPRLDKLFKTERFKKFLRMHLDWLRPECRIQPNSEMVICRSDILPERIREEDANVRDEREFQDKMNTARLDSTGETAWKYYEDYKQRPKSVYIEGESAAEQFLGLAKELKCKSAEMEWLRIAGIDGSEKQALEQSLREGGVPDANISHIMFFFCRVKNCKIDIYDHTFEWCLNASMVTYLAQGEPRFESGRDWMGYPAQRGALFADKLLDVNHPDESSYKIWDKFRTSSIEDLTDGEIVWLTAFFIAVAHEYKSISSPWTPDEVHKVKAIGKILRTKMKVYGDESWFVRR